VRGERERERECMCACVLGVCLGVSVCVYGWVCVGSRTSIPDVCVCVACARV